MSNTKRKWHCPCCSQDSSRHWNLKIHIKRWHNGIGEPINKEYNEFKENRSYQFFSHNQPYGVKNLSFGSRQGKEKEPDMIDEYHQIVIEYKEKLRKIQEIKSFFNELNYFSSSSQQPNTNTNLGQTPMIRPKIPPVTTAPLQQTQPAQSSQEQEQKEENINRRAIFSSRLFFDSTFQVEEFQKRIREEKIEDFIVTPLKLWPIPIITTITSNDNNNNNNIKKSVQANPAIENTKEEVEQDRSDIEEHSSSKPNLLMDNEDEEAIIRNMEYDDSSNIEYDASSSDVSLVVKRDQYGDIYEWYRV